MSNQENFSRHQSEALAAINGLNTAIEKRRIAEAEVGKAQKELATVRAKTATTSEALNSALKEFGEVAMHW